MKLPDWFKRTVRFSSRTVVFIIVVIVFMGFMKFRDFLDYKKVISSLKAESRIAQVLVTQSRFDEESNTRLTTIKFLEFDVNNKPLVPRYFTFHGNLIQFQSLVVRFADELVEKGHPLKGKSIYLFLKAFVLDGADTQVFQITEAHSLPGGYRVDGVSGSVQAKIWERFWDYALDPTAKEQVGVKNAQIEAPGSLFIPGTIYTVKIEHDGGLRIDADPIPEILMGETIKP
jgi:hypothetical protein